MHAITLLLYSLISVACTVVVKDDVTAAPGVVTTSTECSTDTEVVQTCFVCKQLPFGLGLQPEDCCSNSIAFEICKNCIANPIKCLADYIALINGEDPYENKNSVPNDDQNDNPKNVIKRFGRLFLGRRPLSRPVVYELPVTEKRTGVLDLPGPHNSDGNVLKRWGTLNMGSRYGSFNLGKLWKHYNTPYKRNAILNDKLGMYDTETDGQNTEDAFGPEYRENTYKKRYGTLHLGKRYGTLFFGKWYPHLKKRYGTLFLGNGYGLPSQEKRYGTLHLGKKWGTLGLGNNHRYYPTKKDTASNDFQKRYGRLFL